MSRSACYRTPPRKTREQGLLAGIAQAPPVLWVAGTIREGRAVASDARGHSTWPPRMREVRDLAWPAQEDATVAAGRIAGDDREEGAGAAGTGVGGTATIAWARGTRIVRRRDGKGRRFARVGASRRMGGGRRCPDAESGRRNAARLGQSNLITSCIRQGKRPVTSHPSKRAGCPL